MPDGLCVGGWGFGNCGSEGSKAQTSYNQTMNQLCSQTSSFITTNSTKTASSVFAKQTADIMIGGDIGPNCDLTQSQTMNISQQTSGELEDNQIMQLASDISTGLTNMIDQTSSATSDLASGQVASQDNVTLNTNIQNVINRTVTKTNYSEVLSQTFADQGATIKIGGSCNGRIRQEQILVSNVIAMNLLKTVQEALVNDASTTNVFTQLTQTSTATGKGLGALVESFLGGIAGIFGVGADVVKTWLIVCAVVLCVICGGLLAFMLSPAGQEATTTAASAGANIAKARYG
jgi:hypothetical protein